MRLTGDVEVLRQIDGTAAPAPSGLPDPISLDGYRHGATALREAQRDGQRFLELSRRDRLAVLVDYATRSPAPPAAGAGNRLDRAFRSILGAAKIVGFARTGQRDRLVAAIADGLALGPDFVGACLDDATGDALAILLKALRLDTVQAQQVFLLSTPSGRDTAAFFALADLYSGMEATVAETICETWRLTAMGRKVGHVPYVDADDRSRTAAQEARVVARRRQDGRGEARLISPARFPVISGS